MKECRMAIDRGKRLYALRHCAVAGTSGLCYGQMDVPLTENYPNELQSIQQQLQNLNISRIVSSPLQRCQQLAVELQRGPVTLDSRLLELSFGEWEGLFWADIPRDMSEIWTQDVVHRTPPGGESFLQLIDRVRACIHDPLHWQSHESLLLVTHAGVIRALLHILEGKDYETCLWEKVEFGELRSWTL